MTFEEQMDWVQERDINGWFDREERIRQYALRAAAEQDGELHFVLFDHTAYKGFWSTDGGTFQEVRVRLPRWAVGMRRVLLAEEQIRRQLNDEGPR